MPVDIEFRIDLDFEACKGCGYCLEICPRDVFGPGVKYNAKGYLPPLVSKAGDCIGCRRCFLVCPDFCLEVER
jgi:2-oxoglutarate ferredoxin oxidoreductase subunit delta